MSASSVVISYRAPRFQKSYIGSDFGFLGLNKPVGVGPFITCVKIQINCSINYATTSVKLSLQKICVMFFKACSYEQKLSRLSRRYFTKSNHYVLFIWRNVIPLTG